jgi:hypothetical protein
MASIRKKKKGGSTIISLIITLSIIGLSVYLIIQYIPQHMESNTVDSILLKIEQEHRLGRVRSEYELWESINRQLNVNGANDLKASFEVTQSGGGYIIRVNYEREMNLIYKKKSMKYNKILTLK